jgi:hypothetical protein
MRNSCDYIVNGRIKNTDKKLKSACQKVTRRVKKYAVLGK